jgi:hypothetical protein
MPDGGKLGAVISFGGASGANTAGQRALICNVTNRTQGLYLLDADGKPSLILKTGVTTDIGKITLIGSATRPPAGLIHAGFGIGLNSQGQVAFSVSIDGGPLTLVLLMPAAGLPGG